MLAVVAVVVAVRTRSRMLRARSILYQHQCRSFFLSLAERRQSRHSRSQGRLSFHQSTLGTKHKD